jgi:hypothetical protein
MALSRDALVGFKPKTKEINLPDGRGTVIVRELRASEVIDFSRQRETDPAGAIFKLIVNATVDEKGDALFTAKDVDEVAKLPYQISDTLVDGILALTGLTDDTKKKQADATK